MSDFKKIELDETTTFMNHVHEKLKDQAFRNEAALVSFIQKYIFIERDSYGNQLIYVTDDAPKKGKSDE